MNQLVKLNKSNLRISHQSEVVRLRQELAQLKTEIKEIKLNIPHPYIAVADKKITLQSNGQHHFISLSDIIYCEADGNYTKVFIKALNKDSTDSTISCLYISKTLKSLTGIIACSDFIRCHQSYLVNKKHMTGYSSGNGLHLTLTNEKHIPVSRRNKKEVLGMI